VQVIVVRPLIGLETENNKWIHLEFNCDLEYEKPEDVDLK